jgi:hypothetical protein
MDSGGASLREENLGKFLTVQIEISVKSATLSVASLKFV